MFTQCPRCDTIFQLSASHLRAANGDVRCGQCLSVFNALEHLSESVSPTHETETAGNLTHETGEYRNWSEKMPDSVTNTDEPAAGPASTGQMDTKTHSTSDAFNDVIAEVKTHDISMEEIDRFEEFLATNDSFPVEDSPAVDDFLPAEDATPNAITNTNVSDTRSPDKTPASTNATHLGDIDTVTAVLDTDINFDDDEFAEFDAYLDKPENVSIDDAARRTNKIEVDDDKIIIEATDLESFASPAHADTPDVVPEQQPATADLATTTTVAPAEDLQAETVHTTEGQSSPANETQTINIPSLILDDLHAAKVEQLRPSGTPWLIGSLLLMFTLVLQVVYHSRDELARDVNLRPWLIQMCEVLNCAVSQPYDIKQIEIIGRDVRSHPSADKALIVSTTLINNATFVQPFPLLTMVFSDINGTKIAQRRFTPREYLSNAVDLATGMTPDMPIRIDLELVDPGKTAVNYEFHAEVDPRQTRPLT